MILYQILHMKSNMISFKSVNDFVFSGICLISCIITEIIQLSFVGVDYRKNKVN